MDILKNNNMQTQQGKSLVEEKVICCQHWKKLYHILLAIKLSESLEGLKVVHCSRSIHFSGSLHFC